MDLSGAAWRKSSYSSANNDCVELTAPAVVVGVRDSKNPSGTPLVFRGDRVASFLAALKSGQFEV